MFMRYSRQAKPRGKCFGCCEVHQARMETAPTGPYRLLDPCREHISFANSSHDNVNTNCYKFIM